MNIIAIISPLVLVGLAGFISTKRAWFSKTQIDALSAFTFKITIPAFLFQQLANADLSQINLNIYGAFYLPVLAIYAIAWFINNRFHQNLQRDNAASSVYAFCASYSNNVIVGLPVALMLLGEKALPIVFLVVSLHSVLLFGLTSAIAAKEQTFRVIDFLKKAFYNPFILAIFSGFLLNLANISLPSFINESLILLGKPAISLALFLLGASLAFYHIRSEIRFILTATTLKLLLLPLSVFLASHYLFSLSNFITTTLVVLSASPTGVNAYMIAKQHNKHQETCAGTVVITTLVSIVSMPLWLYTLPILFNL